MTNVFLKDLTHLWIQDKYLQMLQAVKTYFSLKSVPFEYSKFHEVKAGFQWEHWELCDLSSPIVSLLGIHWHFWVNSEAHHFNMCIIKTMKVFPHWSWHDPGKANHNCSKKAKYQSTIKKEIETDKSGSSDQDTINQLSRTHRHRSLPKQNTANH